MQYTHEITLTADAPWRTLWAEWNTVHKLPQLLTHICDATPGPVARLVKVAILNRERGREGVWESLEDAGFLEVPRLEEKLNLLATIAQITPIVSQNL